jgi:hypothetical protein
VSPIERQLRPNKSMDRTVAQTHLHFL